METLNITSRSDDWRARSLSNFSADPITLDGRTIASVEGFIQGIKFPEGNPYREQAFRSTGVRAKTFGMYAEREFVWWNDEAYLYGSAEHHALIERAIRAKFEQNTMAREAIVATEGLTLIHETGEPEPSTTSLPATVFCDILTRIRGMIIEAKKRQSKPVGQ